MNNQSFLLYSLLKEISECCQEREAILAHELGCSPAEIRCLITMRLTNCKNTAELSEQMGVAKSRITRILDGLVAKKLVRRKEDKNDRRLCLISFTAKGGEVATELISTILDLHEEVFKDLPKDIRDQTINVLSALRSTMNTIKKRLQAGEFTSSNQVGLSVAD
jgi:DNA-binding MarR family transcriptional regulator